MCPTLNLSKPQVVFSSTDDSIVKLTAMMHEAIGDLLAEYDWQFLRREHTITTTSGVDEYPFPTDIDRFISGTFFDRTNRWEIPGSLTAPVWQNVKAWHAGFPFSRFTIANDRIKFYPTPANALSFACEYVSNRVVNTSGGEPLTEATSDSDIILFDHRLVIALLKLKWLTFLGLDTSAAADDYNDILSAIKSQETPKEIINAAGSCNNYPFIGMHNFPERW